MGQDHKLMRLMSILKSTILNSERVQPNSVDKAKRGKTLLTPKKTQNHERKRPIVVTDNEGQKNKLGTM